MGGRVESKDAFTIPWCCICGSIHGVKWCDLCKHYFCKEHQDGWYIWERGVEALKQWLTKNPPPACPGPKGHVGR